MVLTWCGRSVSLTRHNQRTTSCNCKLNAAQRQGQIRACTMPAILCPFATSMPQETRPRLGRQISGARDQYQCSGTQATISVGTRAVGVVDTHTTRKKTGAHTRTNHRENLSISITLIPTQLGDEATQAQVKAGWVIAPLAGASPVIRFCRFGMLRWVSYFGFFCYWQVGELVCLVTLSTTPCLSVELALFGCLSTYGQFGCLTGAFLCFIAFKRVQEC